MYFSAQLELDPSQLTQIRRKPTHGFARLAEILTAGLTSRQEERETFTALSIVQEIHQVMRSVGVDNVIHFSADGMLLYEDKQGRAGDFSLAIDHLTDRSLRQPNAAFSQLSLLLEHSLSSLQLIIAIDIHRSHPVGVFPIQIALNGLLHLGGQKKPSDIVNTPPSQTAFAEPWRATFLSQSTYDALIDSATGEFETFLEKLTASFHSVMRLDQIKRRNTRKIIRPRRRIHDASDTHFLLSGSNASVRDPVFHHIPSLQTAFFYCWQWADLCYQHNIHCANCTIVDENGADVMQVGENGFDAHDSSTLNLDQPIDVPPDAEVTVFPDNLFSNALSPHESIPPHTIDLDASRASGWLDSLQDPQHDSWTPSGGDDANGVGLDSNGFDGDTSGGTE